ncbi:hypothetical protein GGS23DRAFT_591975 [Durotheca rogersii]|uniref:uncharacterized protein n=1 Tax=Durotheca rogersii TaxID=419775 RepID=UPI0022211EA9|nr:uncharacterized protein GGS23DRAFT_591975 [Durotheca rogersii]KAI5868183.1 hypothetical protein GGS23DRAFT_591975 [Durotheca rogersii]
MSAISYDRIVASKPFYLYVGPNKKEFVMHLELVASLSKPLQTLVKGKMKEARESVAEWPEVDEGTFVRFCEFAYTGSYKPAAPIRRPLPKSQESPTSQPGQKGPFGIYDDLGIAIEDGYVYEGCSMRGSYNWQRETKNKWKLFQAAEVGAGAEAANTEAEDDYGETLLSHARLYVLADMYAVEPLMALCVRRLHRTLKVFRLHGGVRTADLAQLFEYAYHNTRPDTPGPPARVDRLRELLAAYAACRIYELWDNPQLRAALEIGDLSKNILAQLLNRPD